MYAKASGIERWSMSEDWEKSKGWVEKVRREDLSGEKVWEKVMFAWYSNKVSVQGIAQYELGEKIIAEDKAGLVKEAVVSTFSSGSIGSTVV
jgi:hypothetical protein